MKVRSYSSVLLISIISLLLTSSSPAHCQILNDRQIDSLANRALRLFEVPGLAIGIVKDGRLIYSKGFGVRSLKTGLPVDSKTLFGIASNTKAFTAAALGILVDEGKIHWDDKVTRYLPGVRLYDDLATREITIRDLLCHRSGLATGEGDLMHDPDSTNFTVEDIIHNLRYLRPSYSFRSKFAYDNNLYLVAGEVIARVSKMRWEDFIEQRILRPLGMITGAASYNGCKQNPDIIDAHKKIDDSVRVVTRYTSEKDDAAGGIYSNVEDMSKWMLMLLNKGKDGPDTTHKLLSEATAAELWTPQTIIKVGKPGVYNTHFAAYGLGWFLLDVKGYKLVVHTGEDVGMVSEVAMIPELGLGMVVLTNNESNAIDAITYQIIDGYLGVNGIDEMGKTLARLQSGESAIRQQRKKIWNEISRQQRRPPANAAAYVGVYHDNWFGNAKITIRNNRLWFAAERSPQLRGFLLPYHGDSFYIKWENPELDADAIVQFHRNANTKVTGITLESVAPGAGFSYEGLSFHRTAH